MIQLSTCCFDNGDGTFQNQIKYSVGLLSTWAAVGAFRDHTKLDLVVIYTGHDNFAVFFNSCY